MDDVQNEVEKLERQRLRLLTLNLIGFIIWNGLRVVQMYFEVASGFTISSVLMGIGLVGAVIWIWTLVKILNTGRALKNKKLFHQILGDEWFEMNRNKAFRTSLAVVAVAQVLFVVGTAMGLTVSGGLIAEMNILIIVSTFLGSFIFYQGKDDV